LAKHVLVFISFATDEFNISSKIKLEKFVVNLLKTAICYKHLVLFKSIFSVIDEFF